MKPNYLLFLALLFAACSTDSSVTSTLPPVAPPSTPVASPPPPKPSLDTSRHFQFAWKPTYEPTTLLVNRIAPPPGFQRSVEAPGSYADWLRHLPLQAAGSPVLLHNGQRKGRQDVHAAVIDIDVGRADLQQCADAVMRLRAEYWYSEKAYEQIHFNYTSGDRVSFDDWRQGRKPRVSGNRVVFSPKTNTTDNSYANFKKYLIEIFKYAGTASLSKELQRVAPAELAIGDVFIRGGFPGHAVLVVDMVVDAQGQKRFLLAQSYMPAQNIHILRNPATADDSPWYAIVPTEPLVTPEWTFTWEELRRF